MLNTVLSVSPEPATKEYVAESPMSPSVDESVPTTAFAVLFSAIDKLLMAMSVGVWLANVVSVSIVEEPAYVPPVTTKRNLYVVDGVKPVTVAEVDEELKALCKVESDHVEPPFVECCILTFVALVQPPFIVNVTLLPFTEFLRNS